MGNKGGRMKERKKQETKKKVQAVRWNGRTSDKDECNERVDRTGYADSDRSVNDRVTAKDERCWTGRGVK